MSDRQLKDLFSALQLPNASGDQLTVALAYRLLEAMERIERLEARLNGQGVRNPDTGVIDRLGGSLRRLIGARSA